MCEGQRLQSLRELAAELRDDLKSMAADLDKHKKNTNIARVTGGSVAVIGGVISLIGMVAAPFTVGTSAVLTIVGGSIMAMAGGATTGGAKIVRHLIEKEKLDKVSQKWDEFKKKLLWEMSVDPINVQNQGEDVKTTLKEKVKIVKDSLECLSSGVKTAESIASALPVGVRATQFLKEVVTVGGRSMRAAAMAGSGLLNWALIGVSLYDITVGAVQLSMESGSSAGKHLRNMALLLDEFARTGKWWG